MVPFVDTVATAVLLEEYENVPILVELGGVTANGASPYVFEAIANWPKIGVPRVTVNVAEVDPASNNELPICDTVILVVPADTNEMSPVDELTVATLVSLDEYTKGDALVEVGVGACRVPEVATTELMLN